MSEVAIITERQRKLISFALYLFQVNAHDRANAAAQDKDGRYFKPGAVTAFLADAGDAEELLRLMRSNTPLLIAQMKERSPSPTPPEVMPEK
jgi:hypothetical protein